MLPKNKFAIDDSNRLILKRKRKKVITNGEFSVDKDNRLTYWLNEPSGWRREFGLPNKIRFKGNWKLNENYDLELLLDETKAQYKNDKLVLKGAILSVDRDTLAFELRGLDNDNQSKIQKLELSGFWQADELNRIKFFVDKKTLPDELILGANWEINKNQQIIYNYEKTNLKTKKKFLRTLTFTGFWQLDSKNILTYVLSHSSKSRFDFRVQIESPNLYPQNGVIKYRLGAGLKEEGFPSKEKIIPLYGTWKFSRKLGLIFEIDYGEGDVKGIEFGADIDLTAKDSVVFSLVNRERESLGMNITFSHKFLKKFDAETFLRLKSVRNESAIEAGVKIPF